MEGQCPITDKKNKGDYIMNNKQLEAIAAVVATVVTFGVGYSTGKYAESKKRETRSEAEETILKVEGFYEGMAAKGVYDRAMGFDKMVFKSHGDMGGWAYYNYAYESREAAQLSQEVEGGGLMKIMRTGNQLAEEFSKKNGHKERLAKIDKIVGE